MVTDQKGEQNGIILKCHTLYNTLGMEKDRKKRDRKRIHVGGRWWRIKNQLCGQAYLVNVLGHHSAISLAPSHPGFF